MFTVNSPFADPRPSCANNVALAYLLTSQPNIVLGHTQLLLINDTLDRNGRDQLGEIEKTCRVIVGFTHFPTAHHRNRSELAGTSVFLMYNPTQ